ncbi:hypothetical protein [Staphylococcus argensis]|nr:hypothetical protein [Staphylococcus argensis]
MGKQYSYFKGLEEISELEQLKLNYRRNQAKVDIKKVQGSGT